MYYLESLSQAEIAKRVNLSRPQISRYLKRARKVGMVEIKINKPSSIVNQKISSQIKSMLNLKDVVISPLGNASDKSEEKIIESIAIRASSYLPSIISRSTVIGIGWGRTLYKTILAMDTYKTEREIFFVPLIGGIGQTAPHYQVNTLVDRIAEKFSAQRFFLNLPAFINQNDFHMLISEGKLFETMNEYWARLDLAIIGLGGPAGALSAEIEPSIVKRLKEQKAVGDILGQFFKEDGKICTSGMEDKLVGVPISRLSKVENVVCVSGGQDKVQGIISAARAGYFNILITDEMTAKSIIQKLGGD